jgi:hypothetical protein
LIVKKIQWGKFSGLFFLNNVVLALLIHKTWDGFATYNSNIYVFPEIKGPADKSNHIVSVYTAGTDITLLICFIVVHLIQFTYQTPWLKAGSTDAALHDTIYAVFVLGIASILFQHAKVLIVWYNNVK